MFGQFWKEFSIMAIVALIINLAFINGIIYFGVWCLRHFGVI